MDPIEELIQELVKGFTLSQKEQGQDEQLTCFVNNWQLLAQNNGLVLDFIENSESSLVFKENIDVYHIIELTLQLRQDPTLQRFILEFLYNLTLISPINKNRAYSAKLIRLLIESDSNNPILASSIRNLLFSLLELGLSNNQLSLLYKKSLKDPELLNLFTSAFLQYPDSTPLFYLLNDSTLKYDKLILEEIKKGFTLQFWFKLDSSNLEEEDSIISKTPFISIFDDSNNHILQYSFQKNKLLVESRDAISKYFESQVFESFSFESGSLYDITLVHRCDTTKSSRIDLFINGNFIQSLNTSYLFAYLMGGNSPSYLSTRFGTSSSSYKNIPVSLEVFSPSKPDSILFGISQVMFINRAMPLEWVLFSHYLGPNYNGSFQDSNISNLLTERQQTEINLKIQEYNEAGSDLLSKNEVNDVNGKIKFHKKELLLYISASHAFSNGDQTIIKDIRKSSSHKASLASSDILVSFPRPLLDTLYAIGGFGVALRLVELSKSSNSLLNALELLFHVLNTDLRSYHEFESQSGYDILSTLLKTKKSLIDLSILDSVLKFVGYDSESPVNSLLKNPLAYRSLIIDFEIWKPTSLINKDSFKFLLFQFTVFGQDSRFHAYNLKQLMKMKIINRFIQAMKYQLFDKDMLPILHDSLLILINCNPTPESIRALSMYIVYALNNSTTTELQKACGVTALDVLVTLVSNGLPNSSSSNVHKKIFQSINIRWIIILLNDRDPTVLKLVLRLLLKTLTLLGKKSYKYFLDIQGLTVLKNSLQSCGKDSEVLIILLTGVFGISYFPEFGDDLTSFVTKLSSKGSRLSIVMPDLLYVINSLVVSSVDQLNEEMVDFIEVLNSYYSFLSVSYDGIPCLHTFFGNDINWIIEFMSLIMKLKHFIAQSNIENDELNTVLTKYKEFISHIFIEKLFAIGSKKISNLLDNISSHSSVSFSTVVAPLLLNHIQSKEDDLPNLLKDSHFSHSLVKLYLVLLETRKIYRFDDDEFISFLDATSNLLKISNDNNTSGALLKDCKKEFAASFQQFFFRCTYNEIKLPSSNLRSIKFCCSSIMLNPLLYAKVLNNESLLNLIILLFKNLIVSPSDISTLSANCIRLLIMNCGSSNVQSIVNLLPADDVKINARFHEILKNCFSLNDDEFKSQLYMDIELKHVLNKKFSDNLEILEKLDHKMTKTKAIEQIVTKPHSGVSGVSGGGNEKYLRLMRSEIAPLSKAIVNSETKRFHRHIQDDKDDLRYYISMYNSIKVKLPIEVTPFKWLLDSTEGPNRMRKRIVSEVQSLNEDIIPDTTPAENDNYVVVEENNDADTAFEFITSGQPDFETFEEDKHRRILRSLYVGDKIFGLTNVTQIVGLESVESIFITGATHLYIIDNYFLTSNNDIVEVEDAPNSERDPFVKIISGNDQSSSNNDVKEHTTKVFEINNLISISKRKFLLRDVALELFFKNGESFLVTCNNKNVRNNLFNQLHSKITAKFSDLELEEALKLASQQKVTPINNNPQKFSNKIFTAFSNNNDLSFSSITKKWKNGELSNFYYLILVNTIAGRTFNDLTQYPVFPHVIADYESDELDLNDPKTFRDLSKPMGAQTERRALRFQERFEASIEMSPDTPPFHYGTHYSSAMIVTSYLIRLQPFVQSYLILQGGKFDHADRLFYSVSKAWNSSSRDNTSDVRELIPEFYYLPDFLINSNNFNFGSLQTGVDINDVELPPWAHDDPLIFIEKMRLALESDYVSQNLNKWIDLIFGFRQRGENSIKSLNVFHYLSYHGAIDLDNIKDEHERKVNISIIHNFGQTPLQIFQKPHPQKQQIDKKLKCNICTLSNSPLSVLSISHEIDKIVFSKVNCEWKCLDKFNRFNKHIEISIIKSNSIKINNALVFEEISMNKITRLELLDNNEFIIGFGNGVLIIYKLTIAAEKNLKMTHSQRSSSKFNEKRLDNQVGLAKQLDVVGILRCHDESVKEIHYSKCFKNIISLSQDGEIKIWNRLNNQLIRSIADFKFKMLSISDEFGFIAGVSSTNQLTIFDINGNKIIEMLLLDEVSSITFAEKSESNDKIDNSPWVNFNSTQQLVGIGYDNGSIGLYQLQLKLDCWDFEKVKVLKVGENKRVKTLKISLHIELDGNGHKLGRLELIAGDSSNRLMIWR